MTAATNRMGIDIGGSHASFSVIDITGKGEPTLEVFRKQINSTASANEIVNDIAGGILTVLKTSLGINSIGLAFPGPFDYKKGISKITGVGGKFAATYGLHIAQALKTVTGLHNMPFHFFNDAHCFAYGVYQRHRLRSSRTVCITLGTGLGSAFMKEGKLVTADDAIPENGCLYNQPFLSGTAEEYISTRWFFQAYQQQTGTQLISVKELADSNTAVSRSIFTQFGTNLGTFLLPWLQQFDCNELIVGGNLSKAHHLFGAALTKELAPLIPALNILYCNDTEECILTGAALQAPSDNYPQTENTMIHTYRKSTQPLLPVSTDMSEQSGYQVFPSYQSPHPVFTGFHSLAEKIHNEKTVVIDGYGGVLWEPFRQQLQEALQANNRKVYWYDINTCLHDSASINNRLVEHLNGNDPIFGKRYTGELADFFDQEKIDLLQPDPSADICIVYGTGAALSNWQGPLIYADTPKNEIQYRMRAGSITNIGVTEPLSNTQTYKRFYFVDWPVLNKHKEKLLPAIDYMVDEQRISTITWMQGNDFRDTLLDMTSHALRARPWFEAGVWGGNWMKKKIAGLNQDEINYAWSFELITPENGIVLEGNNYLLEVSFDFLLFMNNQNLLGKAAKRFGNEFPIRFDFLDTYDGGNLSVQCHPRPAYIREKFGENFTQDETYYILDCEPGASVYLGFQQGIDAAELKNALTDAQEKSVAVDIEKFIQKKEAHKHDLFLIPNGTVHASGKNNMVLEISNTPYIFTFKMYDWLRLDLNGQPRPINIEHAFNNLYFDRQGDYVEQQLISHPFMEAEWPGGRKLKLPTHSEHFYRIDRYEFTGQITISTNGHCHCCMLVEGTHINVHTGTRQQVFHYAETFIIPAAAGEYQVCSEPEEKAYLVVAYVKDEHC